LVAPADAPLATHFAHELHLIDGSGRPVARAGKAPGGYAQKKISPTNSR